MPDARKRKIVFLDIDGVLCARRSHLGFCGEGLMQHLDPVAVKMVHSLLANHGAELVLSSTWREFHDKISMTAILQNAGMPTVTWHQNWKTPVSLHGCRGKEIAQWLTESGGDCGYLILDDNDDFLPEQEPFFVKTDFDDGLLYSHYKAADKILGDIK